MGKILFIYIKQCDDCPYSDYYWPDCGPTNQFFCTATHRNISLGTGPIPTWCPLTNDSPHDVDVFYREEEQ